MKITIQASDFQQAIQKAYSVVPSRTPMALLESIELKISDGIFTVRSTDLEIQFASEVYAVTKAKKESACITIPGEKFSGLVASIDPEEEIVLDLTEKGLSLKTSKAKYNFTAPDGGELPNLAKEFKSEESFKIGASLLKALIQSTLYAAITNKEEKSFNAAMAGINIKAKGGTVIFCGTTGKILSKSTLEIENGSEFDIVIPAKLANLILKSFNDEELTVSFGAGQIQISNEMISIHSRLIDEQYPNYQAIIDGLNNTKILTCKRTDLLSALKRIGIFSDFETKAVTINLKKNLMSLEIADSETGSDGLENIESVYEDQDFTFIINANYLLADVSHIDSERIKMSFGEEKKPVTIEPLEQGTINFFTLAMPRNK
jgi:DNA polymerase-3 subunit beta